MVSLSSLASVQPTVEDNASESTLASIRFVSASRLYDIGTYNVACRYITKDVYVLEPETGASLVVRRDSGDITVSGS